MTLDPVHVDGIARLAGRVSGGVDERDQQDLAETVWAEFLDPLVRDGDVVLEPLGRQRRRKADVEAVALQDPPFPSTHGLDSGTINPTTFKNGLVMDVSQAAMAAVPSDLELHRARTIVMTVHTNDDTFTVAHDDWTASDEGFVRERVLHAPRVDRYEQNVVHALALYLAESNHALTQADVVDDLLILDGPIYPTGLLKWVERDTELADLLEAGQEPADIVRNYVALIERFVERDVPLLGFVKNSTSKAITHAIRRNDAAPNAPWNDDAAFFTRVLARHDDGDRLTDALTFTDWFVSRVGTDGVLARDASVVEFDPALPRTDYEVTFFVVYDPRDDLLYRVEAPYAFTKDEQLREALTRQVLSEVAAERGPPLAVAKADELARIDRDGKEQLRREIERTFESDRHRRYDDKRWGMSFEEL
ncbi:MAG: DNA double-strand break repair nuclease NurA [Haloarculaceae archaeon]